MAQAETLRLLNQLLALEYRSLPMYLTNASTWTHKGDEKATVILESIMADQRANCQRIAQFILDHGGVLDTGEWPMEYTDTHFLSLDFLLTELVRYQKRLLQEIERIASAVDREARDVVLEVQGNEKAHLEALRELVGQPA